MTRFEGLPILLLAAGLLGPSSLEPRSELVWVGAPAERFGAAVAGVGDVDGDGSVDVAIGAPRATGVGRAYVYSGANGRELFTCAYAPAGPTLGGSIAALGDVDGDRVPDLALGSFPAEGSGAWAVIFSGRTGAALRAFRVPASSGAPGTVVRPAGDLDGDGIGDLAVDTYGAGPRAEYLFSMRDGRLMAVRETGDGAPRACGARYAIEDLNGDGRDEVVVVREGDPARGVPGVVRVSLSSAGSADHER